VLLSWYSLCLIILSTADISQRFEIENSGLIAVCVSVAIFGLSLFIYGERYNERADEFKTCYLNLKALYESSGSTSHKMRRYAEILEQYDNQTDNDYDEMLFDAKIRGQPLYNAHGPVNITRIVFLRVLATRVLKKAVVAAVFCAPLVAAILWVRPAG
jgi:hypothetical protein